MKKISLNLQKHKGFSLIEVIIACSLLSVVSLAVGDLIIQQRKAVLNLEDQLGKVEVNRIIESVLKEGNGCTNTLQGLVVNSVAANVSEIRDNVGNRILESNSTFGNIIINQMKIDNVSVATPSSSGFIDLTVPLTRVRSGGGPKDLRPVVLRLSVAVDGSRAITGCTQSGPGSVTVIETTSSTDCFCNPGETRTGCAGVQPSGYDIYAIAPNGCRGERVDRVQCFCQSP